MFLIDVVILLVCHINARNYGHNLRYLQKIQLISFLLDIKEKFLKIKTRLVSLVERSSFSHRYDRIFLSMLGKLALPIPFKVRPEVFILEDDDENEEKLSEPQYVEHCDEDLYVCLW